MKSIIKILCNRSRREAELHDLQRCIEEETRRHETQLSELRVKHSAAIDNLQEQMDNSKRVRLANTCKNTCMCKLELCHDESSSFFRHASPWRRPRRRWRKRGRI